MRNLIVPIAGESSRFPNMKPKWMLTHPLGDFMVLNAISGLNLKQFNKIFFVCLTEHQDKFQFLDGFQRSLKRRNLLKKSVFHWLDKKTANQPETVNRCIEEQNIRGSIYIKDCDNYFETDSQLDSGNFINYCCLTDFTEINPNNKSYISIDSAAKVENIVEKKIVSTNFCCGGYNFESPEEFSHYYRKLSEFKTNLYISDIIFEMLLEGKQFSAFKAKGYEDWGTAEVWSKYKSQFKTIFVDIDGTLVENSSSLFPPGIGKTKPIQKNIDAINNLGPKCRVIVTTSRSSEHKKVTEKQLKDAGLKYSMIIFDLPHCQRVLINDRSKTNPNSAVSINLERNADNLGDLL